MSKNIVSAFLEVFSILVYWRFWVFKAYYMLKTFYKQTIIGVFWEPFSLLFISGCISILWSVVLKESVLIDYFIYVLTGYAVWLLLSNIVHTGINVFEKHKNEIINEKKSLMFYVFEDLIEATSKFLIVFPFVIIISSTILSANIILMLIKMIVLLFFIILSGAGFIMIFGSLCLFFKDIKLVIDAIMRLMFLLTPIIWKTDKLGEYIAFIWINPFYVYIASGRNILSTGEIGLINFVVLVVQAIILFVSGVVFIKWNENKLRRKAFVL